MVNEEVMQYINDLETDYAKAVQENNQLKSANKSPFQTIKDENLIRWQLDLKEDIEKIYHLLVGNQIERDKEGNLIYVPAKDPKLKQFNEFGISQVMNVMAFYLNRNTILSDYEEDQINEIMKDFSKTLIDLIYNRYDEMFYKATFEECMEIMLEEVKERRNRIKIMYKQIHGVDLDDNILEKTIKLDIKTQNEFKAKVKNIRDGMLKNQIKNYPIIVESLIDSVLSAYNRAKYGRERESLRTARQVTQNEPIGMNPTINNIMPRKQKKLLNPFTWFG